MPKTKSFFVLLILLFVVGTSFQTKQDDGVVRAFRSYMREYSEQLIISLETFKVNATVDKEWDTARVSLLRKNFIECRKAYKRIQMFSSYMFPASERNFNGPVVSEIEDESEKSPQIEYPHGFQVIEAFLWSDAPGKCRRQVVEEIELFHRNISTLSISFRSISVDEPRFVEALQYHVMRVFFMGITSFETPEGGTGLEEARITIRAMIDIINAAYFSKKDNAQVKEVQRQLKRTLSFFNAVNDFGSMDYMSCLRDVYIPLSRSLAQLRIKVEGNYYPPSAINFNAPSVFDETAFNKFFYNPRATNTDFSEDVAELGRTLFFDPLFSENNKRACASCHKPGLAFTDNLRFGASFHGDEKLPRNTPTIINAALQRNHFYDLRADHLEMQIGHVLTNENEMKGNFDSLIARLNASPEYISKFKKTFKGTSDTSISMNSIVNAIAEYERRLVSFNSKFDMNVRGEEHTFTDEELAGFNIFMHKAKCATCHYLPVFNNLVPPEYTKSEWEILGTTESSDLQNPKLDADPGRGGLFKTTIFMNAFKTPTLRNIALTQPYMHNGAFEKLEDVIEFYDRGGGAGLGLDVPNQTLPPDSLHLTDSEKKALLSFMKTLTDTIGLTSKPSHLPPFPGNSPYNDRVVGGEY